jgi:CubicO group peptidase (beta-lactamase class C family)
VTDRPLDPVVRDLLARGIAEGVFPGASACVLVGGEEVARAHAGHAAVDPAPMVLTADTRFDVASLTKVMATTPLVMTMAAQGALDLDAPVGDLLADAGTLARLTPRLLLAHASGLPAWKPFYAGFHGDHDGFRRRLLRDLRALRSDAPPGTKEAYSDIGFCVLFEIVERRLGVDFGEAIRSRVLGPLGLRETTYVPLVRGKRAEARESFAATERCPWRERVVVGEVHDENAWAMGGVAAHSGLFSTAADVARLGRWTVDAWHGRVAGVPEAVARTFCARAAIVSGSDRALGWDGVTRGASSSGRHFGPESVGHTGFTGTSLWIDLAREVVVVLLTNRIHPTRDNLRIQTFRPRFHDAVMEAL